MISVLHQLILAATNILLDNISLLTLSTVDFADDTITLNAWHRISKEIFLSTYLFIYDTHLFYGLLTYLTRLYLWTEWAQCRALVPGNQFNLLWHCVVVFPTISHFQHKLLPQMCYSTQPPVAMVDNTHANGESMRKTAYRRWLELLKHLL